MSALGFVRVLTSPVQYRLVDFDVILHFEGESQPRLQHADTWFQKVLRPFRLCEARRSLGQGRCRGQSGEHIPRRRNGNQILVWDSTSCGEALSVTRAHNRLSFYYRLPDNSADDDVPFLTRAEEATVDHAVTRSLHKIWVHAACLVRREALVFLVAPSGCGKTTLSLGLINHGFLLATDDVVLFDVIEGCLIPCPRCPRIRGTALSELARIGIDLRTEAELIGRYVILPASQFQLTSPPLRRDAIHVFFLVRGESSVSESLTNLSFSQGVIETAKSSNLLSQDPNLEFFERVFGEASFYRLQIGDYAQNLDQVMTAVER